MTQDITETIGIKTGGEWLSLAELERRYRDRLLAINRLQGQINEYHKLLMAQGTPIAAILRALGQQEVRVPYRTFDDITPRRLLAWQDIEKGEWVFRLDEEEIP